MFGCVRNPDLYVYKKYLFHLFINKNTHFSEKKIIIYSHLKHFVEDKRRYWNVKKESIFFAVVAYFIIYPCSMQIKSCSYFKHCFLFLFKHDIYFDYFECISFFCIIYSLFECNYTCFISRRYHIPLRISPVIFNQ